MRPRRPSDAVAIAGKSFLDEWLAETHQPVGWASGSEFLSLLGYVLCVRADGLFPSLYILHARCSSWLVAGLVVGQSSSCELVR